MPRRSCLTARYDDAPGKIIDGAVFVFAHGTNPEATLFLEAVQTSANPRWQFAVGRSCLAEFHVLRNDKEVHHGRRLESWSSKESFWLGARSEKPSASAPAP